MSTKINLAEKLLIIVESSNKVKTISNILKKAGYTNTTVLASIGHIMSLGDGGPAFNSGIYPEQQFKMNLKVSEGKKKIINNISVQATKAAKILIMTDGDREGEIIAWSLIKFCDLPIEKCYRIIVHEITPKAINEAIKNPKTFNSNLVNAGLTRIMVDKLIGYGLSPLSKKYLGARSIGRCQSVGLKLISDREKEINEFVPELYFDLFLNFIKNEIPFKAKYVGYKTEEINKFNRQADVDAVVADCKDSSFFITNIRTIEHKESPKFPFCTATFQQEAANKLGLKVKDAMSCAQKLFEGINIAGEHIGLITYMRTDSTEITEDFLPDLKDFIINTFGTEYYMGPRKAKKRDSDQNGHEALRVTNLEITPEILANYTTNSLILKVYKLIWQRTVASVMSNAKIAETIYTITGNGHNFELNTKKIAYDGYKKVYEFSESVASDTKELFSLSEQLEKPELKIIKKFTQPKARYTEASLIKELQQKEIGRPSTYVSIVETILSTTRGYAKLEEKQIVPTDKGMQLADYCNRAFPTLINIEYTKKLEEILDKIAEGKISWLDYMNIFYKNLQEIIVSTKETGIVSDMPEKICPKCSANMIIRRSRFGKLFYGCSKYPKCTGILNID